MNMPLLIPNDLAEYEAASRIRPPTAIGFAQRRLQQLLDRCMERIEVRMEDRHGPDIPHEGWDAPLELCVKSAAAAAISDEPPAGN